MPEKKDLPHGQDFILIGSTRSPSDDRHDQCDGGGQALTRENRFLGRQPSVQSRNNYANQEKELNLVPGRSIRMQESPDQACC
jgi:hypothetical protein